MNTFTFIVAFLFCSVVSTYAQSCGVASVSLTQAQKDELLDAHNKHRSDEGGANIMKMKWNEDLAIRAQEWGNQCYWEHDYLETCDGTSMGQNLWVNYSPSGYPAFGLTAAVKDWYDEKSDYHKASQSCNAGAVCGHYTQVVWATSNEVGCAMVQCPVLGGLNTQNSNYLVCDYLEAGNMQGVEIWADGAPCSQCDSVVSGGYVCEDNLCVDCTPNTNDACICTQKTCANGGNWNNGNCKCDCPSGFYGVTCENSCECKDASPYCNQWTMHCTNDMYKQFMLDNCENTCNMCNKPAVCNSK